MHQIIGKLYNKTLLTKRLKILILQVNYLIRISIMKNKINKPENKKEKGKKEKSKKLQELISKITPENTHKEIKWGNSVGKELW